jgi:hypothetical protein
MPGEKGVRMKILRTILLGAIACLLCSCPQPAPTGPIGAPSSLQVIATSSVSLHLQWQDNATAESGFKIYRGASASGDFTNVGTAAADVASYDDTGLSSNTEYFYRVTAFNADGESDPATVSGKTAATATSAPSAPTGATVTNHSDSSITFGWTDTSTNENGFSIYRSQSESSGFTTPLATVAANATSHTDTSGLVPSTTYYYRITAYNSAGESAYTQCSMTTSALDAPALACVSSASAQFTISLTYLWGGGLGSTNDHYELERSSTSSTSGFALIKDNISKATSPAVVNETPPSAGTYYYRARAYKMSSYSLYSQVKSVIYSVSTGSSTTLTASADNLLMYSTIYSGWAKTVYRYNYLAVGQQWAVGYNVEFGFYVTDCISTRSLIKFTLPSILNGKTITKAELRLSVNLLPGDPGYKYTIAAVSQDWNTSTVTYTNCPVTYGGSDIFFDQPVTTVAPLVIDVKAIVQKWASGTWANYGFLLSDPDISYPLSSSLRASELYSMEASDPDLRPQLYIEY